jgi:hypothetical protein
MFVALELVAGVSDQRSGVRASGVWEAARFRIGASVITTTNCAHTLTPA